MLRKEHQKISLTIHSIFIQNDLLRQFLILIRENVKKQVQFRQEVKVEYEQSYNDYFDDEGLAYELQPVSDTHLVALPEKG